MPTLGVAVRRMPMVRKPASAATVTNSDGVVSSTVRWAREICRVIVSQTTNRRHDVPADEGERPQHLLVVAGNVPHHHFLETERAVMPKPLDDRVRAPHQQLGLPRP